MSNSIFQSVIGQLREATDRVLGVIDTDGNVVSCTDPVLLGERWADAALRVGSADGLVTVDGKVFKPIVGNSNFYEYAVFCGGEDELARGLCAMAHVALSDAKALISVNNLAPPGTEEAPPEVRVMFGGSDGRWIEAMK